MRFTHYMAAVRSHDLSRNKIGLFFHKDLTHYIYFPSWDQLMDFMMRGLEIGPYELK